MPVFPCIPGLLSFREAPALLHAFEKVRHIPDIVFIDGHGLSHPRSAGIACHVGVCLDKPTIGCAGTFDGIVPSGIVRHIWRERVVCYFMVIDPASRSTGSRLFCHRPLPHPVAEFPNFSAFISLIPANPLRYGSNAKLPAERVLASTLLNTRSWIPVIWIKELVGH